MNEGELIRINRYLALKNYCTRKKADELIKAGKVMINGRKAVLGDKVKEGDVVEVDSQAVRAEHAKYIYVAYYKPKGIVTHSAQGQQQDIADVLKIKPRVSPIGRLDRDSEGLIILSNDGRLSERLLHPRFEHDKEYEVKVDHPINDHDLGRLERGVVLPADELSGSQSVKTKPAKTRRISPVVFAIVLTEGKKHQVRRMAEVIGYQVVSLKRFRVMNITLGALAPGKYRTIRGDELKTFLKSLGL